MAFSIEDMDYIEKLLKSADEGLSIDQLLIQLHMPITNYNRIILLSQLKWNAKITINYLKLDSKKVITIFKIVEKI
ncbi:hypothetical protein KZS08_002564, partial [Enterococcus faecalis]|nr:hypothetical protein [Enterococcus faecalis]